MNLIKAESSYNLLIPRKVKEKIDIWCRQVPNNEWSGILYYTVQGSFEKPDFKITAEDFLVLDIGTSTHTEYEHTAEVIEYADKNDLLNCYQACIHSHNVLNSFFSGEDEKTLYERGMQMPHFLSLIVNNRGEYVARITKRGIHFKYDYPTFDGKTATHDKDGDVVIYHDLKITVEDNSIEKEINDRVKELMKNKTSSMHDISPVYPNLFSPIMHESWKTERNDEGEIETVPTTVDSHDVDKMFLQLVTGAVLVREDKPFDLDSWIRNSMEKAYRRSFPDENSMLEWFDVYCEYLLRSEKNSYNRSIDDAYDMRDALYEKCESYKGNRIMTLIQRALSNAL